LLNGERVPVAFVRFTAKMMIFSLLCVGIWLALNQGRLASWSHAHRQKVWYEDRLHELDDELDRLNKQRGELARGGFSAEKALRERFIYARPNEQVLLYEVTTDRPSRLAEADSLPTQNTPE
jgi:hypothetical protein